MSEPVDSATDGSPTEVDLPVPGSSSRSVTPTSNQGFLEQVAQWGVGDHTPTANAEGSSSATATASPSGPSSAPRGPSASVSSQMLLGKKGSFSPPPSRPPPGPPPSGPPPLPPLPATPTGPALSYTIPAASHPFATSSPNANRSSPISKRTVSSSTPISTPVTYPHSQAQRVNASVSANANAYASPSHTSPTPVARGATSSLPYASATPGSGSGLYPGSSYGTSSSTTLASRSHHRPSMTSTLPPALPPPTSALPELPSSVTGHRRTISISSRTSRGSKRLSQSPPRVSPRNSSLLGMQQQQSASFSAASSSSSHVPHPFASTSTLPAQSQAPGPSRTSKPPRTPSRHLLQTALDLAQRAVEMDKRNDVTGALAAYREAVSRLKSVMERVGVEPTENGKPRKSTGRTEEEGRTLRGIHDAYEARIVLLSSFEDAQVADEDEPEVQDQRTAAHATAIDAAIQRGGQRTSASQSTATLVPAQRGQAHAQALSSGEGTPRPSLDDAGTGIGNFMMTTQGDTTAQPLDPIGTSSSGHGSPEDTNITSPFSSRPLSTRTSSLHSSEPGSQVHPQPLHKDVEGSQIHIGYTAMGSPIQPPPRRTSMIAQQYAQHGPSSLGSPASARYSDSSHASQTPNESSGSRRRTTPRTSLGIENELNITEEEPEDGMEVLARTPHAAQQPRQHPLVAAQLSPRRESMPGHASLSVDDRDRPLPPLPNSAPVVDQAGRVVSGSHNRQASSSSLTGQAPSGSILVNPSVQQATIAQRRTSRGVDGVPLGSAAAASASSYIDGLPGSANTQPFPRQPHPSAGPSSAASSVHTPRNRTRSQPGSASGRMSTDEVPPLPHTIRHRTSFTSSLTGRVSSQSSLGHSNGLRINTDHSSSLVPPLHTSSRSSMRSHSTLTRSPSGTLISPVPEPQPPEIVHRSFHLLRLICKSMDPMSTGAYLTASIHISPAVWQPSAWSKPNGKLVNPPRIVSQDVKFRVLETMCFHLDLINKNARDLIDGDRAYAHGRRIPGSPDEVERTRKQAEVLGKELTKSLGALDEDMTVGYKSLMKAGVPVGSWKEKGGGKKAGNSMSWSSKLKDKMTNGRTLESPDKYVDLLSHFAFVSQVLNEHLLNFTGLCTPHYAVMPEIQYRQVESRISSAAGFFSAALVPFILDDVMQFVSRYIKGGAKYLEE